MFDIKSKQTAIEKNIRSEESIERIQAIKTLIKELDLQDFSLPEIELFLKRLKDSIIRVSFEYIETNPIVFSSRDQQIFWQLIYKVGGLSSVIRIMNQTDSYIRPFSNYMEPILQITKKFTSGEIISILRREAVLDNDSILPIYFSNLITILSASEITSLEELEAFLYESLKRYHNDMAKYTILQYLVSLDIDDSRKTDYLLACLDLDDKNYPVTIEFAVNELPKIKGNEAGEIFLKKLKEKTPFSQYLLLGAKNYLEKEEEVFAIILERYKEKMELSTKIALILNVISMKQLADERILPVIKYFLEDKELGFYRLELLKILRGINAPRDGLEETLTKMVNGEDKVLAWHANKLLAKKKNRFLLFLLVFLEYLEDPFPIFKYQFLSSPYNPFFHAVALFVFCFIGYKIGVMMGNPPLYAVILGLIGLYLARDLVIATHYNFLVFAVVLFIIIRIPELVVLLNKIGYPTDMSVSNLIAVAISIIIMSVLSRLKS